MECSRTRVVLLENADTGLPAEVRESVDAHLAGCPACRRQFEAIRDQTNALRSLRRMEAPVTLLEAVRRELERPSLLGRISGGLSNFFKGGHVLRFAGTAAAAVIIVATAHLALRDSGGEKAKVAVAPPAAEVPSPAPAKIAPLPGMSTPAEDAGSAIAPSPATAPPPLQAGPRSHIGIGRESSPGRSGSAAAAPGHSTYGELARQGQPVEITLEVPVSPQRGPSRRASGPPPVKPESRERYSASAPMAVQSGTATKAEETEQLRPELQTPKSFSQEDSILSQIRLSIIRANGKILSTATAGDRNDSVSLLSEIPAENYPSLHRELSLLGATGPPAGEQTRMHPGATVRLRIKLVPRE